MRDTYSSAGVGTPHLRYCKTSTLSLASVSFSYRYDMRLKTAHLGLQPRRWTGSRCTGRDCMIAVYLLDGSSRSTDESTGIA